MAAWEIRFSAVPFHDPLVQGLLLVPRLAHGSIPEHMASHEVWLHALDLSPWGLDTDSTEVVVQYW